MSKKDVGSIVIGGVAGGLAGNHLCKEVTKYGSGTAAATLVSNPVGHAVLIAGAVAGGCYIGYKGLKWIIDAANDAMNIYDNY